MGTEEEGCNWGKKKDRARRISHSAHCGGLKKKEYQWKHAGCNNHRRHKKKPQWHSNIQMSMPQYNCFCCCVLCFVVFPLAHLALGKKDVIIAYMWQRIPQSIVHLNHWRTFCSSGGQFYDGVVPKSKQVFHVRSKTRGHKQRTGGWSVRCFLRRHFINMHPWNKNGRSKRWRKKEGTMEDSARTEQGSVMSLAIMASNSTRLYYPILELSSSTAPRASKIRSVFRRRSPLYRDDSPFWRDRHKPRTREICQPWFGRIRGEFKNGRDFCIDALHCTYLCHQCECTAATSWGCLAKKIKCVGNSSKVQGREYVESTRSFCSVGGVFVVMCVDCSKIDKDSKSIKTRDRLGSWKRQVHCVVILMTKQLSLLLGCHLVGSN